MDKAWWDRWSPASGIIVVVLLIVGFVVLGDFPTAADTPDDFATFYQEERGRVLAGTVTLGLAFYAFFFWVAAVAGRVRSVGEPRLTAAIVAGGTAFAAMILAVLGMHAAIAHMVAEEVNPEVVKGLDTLITGVDVMSGLPLAAFAFAFGVAVLRSRFLDGWIGYASLLGALIFVLSATTWARDGFWSPYGAFTWAVVAVFALWVLAVSALLISRPPADQPLTSMPQAGSPESTPGSPSP